MARNPALMVPIVKGDNVTVKAWNGSAAIPMLFSESKVIATPLAAAVRLAGTLELVGLDLSIDRARLEAVRRAPAPYVGWSPVENGEARCGLRPCTPDGRPLLDRSRHMQNLIVATGHAMLGMSLGPVTGRLVSQVVSGQSPIELDALRPERFGWKGGP